MSNEHFSISGFRLLTKMLVDQRYRAHWLSEAIEVIKGLQAGQHPASGACRGDVVAVLDCYRVAFKVIEQITEFHNRRSTLNA